MTEIIDLKERTASGKTFQEHVDEWLKSNQDPNSPGEFYHGVFPLGMVGMWIQRATEAEQSLAAARRQVEGLTSEILRIDRIGYPSRHVDAIDRLARQCEKQAETPIDRPRIVCLCGSTRFMDAFQQANLRETLAGRIVLSVGCNTKSDGDLFKGADADEIKERLDALHKRKIDLADEVLVLDVGGYVGESTKSEIAHAVIMRKPIRYLSKEPTAPSPAPAAPEESEPDAETVARAMADIEAGRTTPIAEVAAELRSQPAELWFKCPKCGGTEHIVSLGGHDNFGRFFPETVRCGELLQGGCGWSGTWAEVAAANAERKSTRPSPARASKEANLMRRLSFSLMNLAWLVAGLCIGLATVHRLRAIESKNMDEYDKATIEYLCRNGCTVIFRPLRPAQMFEVEVREGRCDISSYGSYGTGDGITVKQALNRAYRDTTESSAAFQGWLKPAAQGETSEE